MGIAARCLKYLSTPERLDKKTSPISHSSPFYQEIKSFQKPQWRYSEKLGLNYKQLSNGDCEFEDGTLYKREELSYLKLADAKSLQFLHKLKVSFPGAILSDGDLS